MTTERVVYCEGFHDRAFWKGWLSHLGCVDLGIPKPGSSVVTVTDPWKRPVTRGKFGFQSRGGEFVQVVPCGGKDRIIEAARQRLNSHDTHPVSMIAVNEDTDLDVGNNKPANRDSIAALARGFDSSASLDSAGNWRLSGGTILLSLILWEANDPPTDGVPKSQTLERLVSASICAAYPARGNAVRQWLESRPSPPPSDVKEFSWSYMAGWKAKLGGEAFFSSLWEDPAVSAQLRKRLELNGAWAVAEALAT